MKCGGILLFYYNETCHDNSKYYFNMAFIIPLIVEYLLNVIKLIFITINIKEKAENVLLKVNEEKINTCYNVIPQKRAPRESKQGHNWLSVSSSFYHQLKGINWQKYKRDSH
jgi:hypothetical protein